jgi:hypothetical protein
MSHDDGVYALHSFLAQPLGWEAVAEAVKGAGAEAAKIAGGAVFGAWRSQIGRPRDLVTVITRWPELPGAISAEHTLDAVLPTLRHAESIIMTPTLRPLTADPPRRQGNFAFRSFTLPETNLEEFLELCAGAWPGFESAYDSQIIGMWRRQGSKDGEVTCLLLTRRPNLAMWERSKIPENPEEAEVRRKLSRRYDLCIDTDVFTTTLLTAKDTEDIHRWT